MRFYAIFIALIIFILMIFSFFLNSVNSDSPFANQQYLDQRDDWQLIKSPTGTFKILNPDGSIITVPSEVNKEKCKMDEYPDIKGVSFNSDGKNVYATLWVNPILINQSVSYNQVRNSWISGGYQMPIDIPSVYDNGTDYVYRIEWNPRNHSWSQVLEERNLDSGGKNRIYGLINDSKDFYNSDRKYVTFLLNRSTVSLPDRYKIIFSTWGAFQNDEGHLCVITDTTSFIDIPPPQFNLSISDLPTYIRKGQKIDIPVHITSDSGINSQAILNAAYNDQLITLDINPEKVNIPPYSVGDSLLEIKALDSRYPAQVRLNATFSYASSPVLQGGSIISTPSINSIYKEIRFSLGILPELSLYDYVSNTLGTWGAAASQAIALITAAGGAVTAILVITTRLRGRQGQNDNEEK